MRFLNTTLSTALIIEDDTDWSLTLRHTQIPLFAALVCLLFNYTSSTTDYWGPTSTWDILYPGHCDDLLFPLTYLAQPHIAYFDPSVPAHHVLHPNTQSFLPSLSLPAHTRLVHRAYWPFCTFVHAVTRQPAERILANFSVEKHGGISAFDVQMLEACRDGRWRCWSVAPEVFHHVVGRSEIVRMDMTERMGGELKMQMSERGVGI